MIRLLLLSLAITALFASSATADERELGRLLSQSDHVLVVDCVVPPRTNVFTVSERTLGNFDCEFKIVETLKGCMQPGIVFNHTVQMDVRDSKVVEMLKERLKPGFVSDHTIQTDAEDLARGVLPERDQRYVLFLKGGDTTDYRFGVQRHSLALCQELTRLAKEQPAAAVQPKHTPRGVSVYRPDHSQYSYGVSGAAK